MRAETLPDFVHPVEVNYQDHRASQSSQRGADRELPHEAPTNDERFISQSLHVRMLERGDDMPGPRETVVTASACRHGPRRARGSSDTRSMAAACFAYPFRWAPVALAFDGRPGLRSHVSRKRRSEEAAHTGPAASSTIGAGKSARVRSSETR